MKVKLIVVAGQCEQAEYTVHDEVVIGRSRKKAALRLDDQMVSREHCRVFERNGKACVEDLASLNGTLINSDRISTEAELKPGDLLTVGGVTFRVLFDPPAATHAGEAAAGPMAAAVATTVDFAGAPAAPAPESDELAWLSDESPAAFDAAPDSAGDPELDWSLSQAEEPAQSLNETLEFRAGGPSPDSPIEAPARAGFPDPIGAAPAEDLPSSETAASDELAFDFAEAPAEVPASDKLAFDFSETSAEPAVSESPEQAFAITGSSADPAAAAELELEFDFAEEPADQDAAQEAFDLDLTLPSEAGASGTEQTGAPAASDDLDDFFRSLQ
jgi:predicted component of type VI protein secretion system